ncbi:MAG: type 2 isopentenyl-diphosphate Delta-isomerase [bacterium]|nr:type 2 isopentenyl-diphosphate Delta-isomerase [bacterium]
MAEDLIQKRKREHLEISLSPIAQTGVTGFDSYRFVHNALPEIDFDEIDTSIEFLGKKLAFPFFISSMTGGVAEGERINKNLLRAAEEYGLAMGVGSQRAAVEKPELSHLFATKSNDSKAMLFANVGVVQLNYGFTIEKYQRAVEMISADALILHLNPIQEAVQAEGDRNFKNLLPRINELVKRITVPIIIKEVGFGISEDVCQRLYDVGVRSIDTAGWGGTSWSVVEGRRQGGSVETGNLFGNWGIPTTDSILMCRTVADRSAEKLTILASGGVRNGLDVAKAISLGADLVGLAGPFGKAAIESEEAVARIVEQLARELKIAMFGVGAGNLSELKQIKLVN